MEKPIVIRDLEKSYGSVRAVDTVSLEVFKGEIFGLIGPDGAGKTTIIRMLVSLLTPDGGELFFQGRSVLEEPRFVRANVGYMPQRFSLYRDLSVEQNLRFFGDLFGIPREQQAAQTRQLYDFSRLGPFKHRLAGKLSGGMKQKLALSCMLMHEPEVIVLDEPTFGVDPVSRSEFWEILKTLAERGITILVSTAYMDEATLCDRVALMHNGHILAMDEPDVLAAQYPYAVFRLESDEPHALYNRLKSMQFAGAVQLFGDGIHLADRDEIGVAALEQRLNEADIHYNNIQQIKAGLEDLFLERMQ